MLKGSCLCGAVRYEIDGALEAITNCHCSLCRKMSGSAFSSGASVSQSEFRIVAGKEMLNQWESSPGYFRNFCSRCGSPLFKIKAKDPNVIRLRVGSLDSDPGVKISKHMHVKSKAPWVELNDGLPQTE
ncbi:MAG: GFA family protein [Deltaproteobacteria bacterium]|nr:GFA family protein [Deltaproteobacteria bacterium]